VAEKEKRSSLRSVLGIGWLLLAIPLALVLAIYSAQGSPVGLQLRLGLVLL
jgi:hypothetical protein